MGVITIKVPQDIQRDYEIDSPEYAREILEDLDKNSYAALGDDRSDGSALRNLKKLVEGYRKNPDAETRIAVETAEAWRDRWNG